MGDSKKKTNKKKQTISSLNYEHFKKKIYIHEEREREGGWRDRDRERKGEIGD